MILSHSGKIHVYAPEYSSHLPIRSMIHYQDWNDQAIHKHLRLKLEPSMHELGQNWLLIPLNHITSKFRQEECGVQLAARRSELSQQPQDLCNGTKSMARWTISRWRQRHRLQISFRTQLSRRSRLPATGRYRQYSLPRVLFQGNNVLHLRHRSNIWLPERYMHSISLSETSDDESRMKCFNCSAGV